MVAESYIPKEATQQIEFLKKYPKYDGRGIKIAVIDTDVADTCLPGMQKTSTGLPKIIVGLDRFKVTVDTSKIVETQFVKGETFIIGLSGRKLNIPSTWENVADKWHIGSVFLKGIDYAKTKVNEELDQTIYERASLKGVVIDCIVWYDGKKWCACLDTSFLIDNLNLENAKVLTNYEDEHEIADLDKKSTFCINICDDGNLIHMMHPHDSHATFVSHVAAGYFPGKPKCNGLAPGAQIVSMNAADLKKALLKCIDMEVDIVTMSWQDELATYITNKKIIEQMVNDYGIIITKSAGNDGPFYASVPSLFSLISEYVLFIGSIFTTDQLELKSEVFYTENVNSVNNFSSKGPLPCGARGIDFVAPGAVISDLPKWYSQKNEACYGTSFAAPQVAGSIACLLSALKANNIPYSPSMIKIALANTAFLPEGGNKLAYVNGLIQINDAFEFIKNSINKLPLKTLTPISIDQPDKKGILCYQNKNESAKTFRYYVNMDSALDTKWILKCTSNGEKFISYSKTDNFFMVTIDASLLEEGSLNYAEIHGINPLNSSNGPLFYLPVTVICPTESFIDKEICLKPNSTNHFFFKCPSESHRCHITITAKIEKEEKEMVIKLENRRKKDWFSNKTKQHRCLRFTAKRNINSTSFEVAEKEAFGILISHTNLNPLNIKLDIGF